MLACRKALFHNTCRGKAAEPLFSRLSLFLLARFASTSFTMASVNMTNPDTNNGDVKLITSLLGRHQGEFERFDEGKLSR